MGSEGAERLHVVDLDGARAGHHDELVAEPELHAVDPYPGSLGLVLRARQLVGRADADHLFDARQRPQVRDALDIAAHDADDGALLAHAQERLEPVLLDGAPDPLDLFLRRRRTHHHDHRSLPRLSILTPSLSRGKQKTQELSLPASAGTSACAGEIYSPASYPLAVKPLL